ncbi:MAG: esterase family protein [Verrucomicrobiales bacterium]|nr:esterase family protein [Verrucomicrobiales bacterium]
MTAIFRSNLPEQGASTMFATIEISRPELLPAGVSMVTVKSEALNRRADVSVYVPPGNEGRAMPQVVLLHGVYGSHWAWLFKGAAHQVLTRLMQEEGLPPMALVMPSDGLWGDGSGYLKHRDADYSRWIVEEVPQVGEWVCPQVAGQPVFLAGLSMGGYGTLRLGALHAQRFAGLSAHSSVTDGEDLKRFLLKRSGEMDLVEQDPLDAFSCLQNHAENLPPLRLDCGLEDELLEANRRLHARLLEAGIPHDYAEFPGGHTWEYWETHLADALRFFASILETQSAVTP